MKLVYAHDGLDFYDSLFLASLNQKYDTFFVTFDPNPSQIPEGIPIIKMPDLVPPIGLHPFDTGKKHILTLARAAAFKKCLSKLNADVIRARALENIASNPSKCAFMPSVPA